MLPRRPLKTAFTSSNGPMASIYSNFAKYKISKVIILDISIYGMCERIHQILDHMMERVMEEDPSIHEKIALSWAVNAHNNMNMESGYSPRFLMFGEAQDLPGIWTAGPAGLEEMDLPARVAQHLHAREIARKVQVQADTCIRLKRALRANIRPTGDKKELGTWVYMKRMEDKQWKGPGQVWVQLGTNIMVKQGSTIWHARHEDCIA